jgi:CheY-like chemotaxis protein
VTPSLALANKGGYVSTVLIADEDRDTRTILATALELDDVDVLEADSPEAAYYAARRRPVDLIILNYPMRLGSGPTLTATLRKSERTRRLPILNLTSHVTPDVLAAARADGVTFTLSKPAELPSILELVRALLSTQSPRSPPRR